MSLMPNPRGCILLLSCYHLNFFLLPSYICLFAYLVVLLICYLNLSYFVSYRIVLHAVLYCFTIDFLDSFQNSRQFQFPPKIEIIRKSAIATCPRRQATINNDSPTRLQTLRFLPFSCMICNSARLFDRTKRTAAL